MLERRLMDRFSPRRWVVAVALLAAWLASPAAPALGQRLEVREADSEQAEGSADTSGSAKPDLAQVEQQIVKRTNEFRAEQGRAKVESNKHLKAAAQYFADYMARTGRYGHTADGQQPSQRAEKHGYDYCMVSENIAYQYDSAGFETEALAKAFTQGWIDSPGHRRNMLEQGVVDTGVAVARAQDGKYFAVQMFGRPKSMQVEFKVSNQSGETVRYTLGDQSFPLPPRVTRTHQRCRTPELRFQWPEGQKPTGTGGDALQPKDGTQYVVRKDDSGKFALEVQAPEAAPAGSDVSGKPEKAAQ